MIETAIGSSAPVLVRVVPISIHADSHSSSDYSDCEEERDGNVFVGLKFAMVIYAVLALGIATCWKLYHLFS